MLQIILLALSALFLIGSYLMAFMPEMMITMSYPAVANVDIAHMHMTKVLAVFCIVFAVGMIFAAMSPRKNTGIIKLVALLHFGIFVLDLILLVRGEGPGTVMLLVEMVYAIVIAGALLRLHPKNDQTAALQETAEHLVGAVEKKLDKKVKLEAKQEQQMSKKMGGVLQSLKKEAKKEV